MVHSLQQDACRGKLVEGLADEIHDQAVVGV
jgi:hypothetical protein